MLLSKTYRAMAILAALALPMVGCADDTDNTGPGDGTPDAATTQLTVKLTDADGGVTAAVVTISEIYLVGSGDQSHVTLTTAPVTANVVDLANSTKTLVDQAVANGNYSELRFVITGAYIEVDTGSVVHAVYASSPDYAGLPAGTTVTGELQMPSLAQSGLKVDLPQGAIALTGGSETLLLDFDVSQSFGSAAGNSGMWVMHPVIKGDTSTVAAKAHATLTVADSVTLPGTTTLADFSAVLTNPAGGTEAQPLADENGDGTFDATFDFLLPGEYTVSFKGPDDVAFDTAPDTPIAITVSSGSTLDASTTIIEAGPVQ